MPLLEPASAEGREAISTLVGIEIAGTTRDTALKPKCDPNVVYRDCFGSGAY
jgi:hypothetical protein